MVIFRKLPRWHRNHPQLIDFIKGSTPALPEKPPPTPAPQPEGDRIPRPWHLVTP
ncbi:hypothetical protein [Hyalangium sp.]|uniref:hypothetical protein n=1 Tax=Hyalangium sp. TaxID=2028555 RepID=UPI002D48F5E1|nr:hypothetical protein [Hyalangium sp.]HYH99373.1 hypothetical protein [Hyalangium sp.]